MSVHDDPLEESLPAPPAPTSEGPFVDREGVAVTIRPYRPSDQEALRELYETFDPRHAAQGIPAVTRTHRERWLEHLLSEGVNVVADLDGRIVGHALYTPTTAPTPELAVFVHQDFHDRGVGTELCRTVVATAAAADREALVLDVEGRNRRARHVYRSLGFESVETGAGEIHMRLALTRRPAPRRG